jgi:hypothetical protein
MQKSEILNPGKDPELLVFVVLLILSQFHPFFAKWHRRNQVHIFAATIHQGGSHRLGELRDDAWTRRRKVWVRMKFQNPFRPLISGKYISDSDRFNVQDVLGYSKMSLQSARNSVAHHANVPGISRH